MQFLRHSRFDKEKGIIAFVDMIQYFLKKNRTLPFSVHICGTGNYAIILQALAEKSPQIIYHGRTKMEDLKKIASECQYCLMPSTFLETFGLSALDALSRGLPVIGYKKGGLEPFIISGYNLAKYEGTESQQLISCVENICTSYDPEKHMHDKNIALTIAQKYTQEQRIKHLQNLLPHTAKHILMVSDFITKVGGIEIYIHRTADALRSMGYTVEIIGTEIAKNKRGKLQRYAGIFLSIYNIFFAKKIKKKIQTFKPDLIRCHSMLRYAGRLPLRVIEKSGVTTWMMYHDFGYICPFPHALENVSDLPKVFSLRAWLHAAKTYNPITLIAVTYKYITANLLKKQIVKTIDFHIVPSEYMQDIFIEQYGLVKKKIGVLEHCIQE